MNAVSRRNVKRSGSCRWRRQLPAMNHRMDSGHVNNGFSAGEEFGSSIHFDAEHYDEIDLGVKEVTLHSCSFCDRTMM
jgi:hypothetical protein